MVYNVWKNSKIKEGFSMPLTFNVYKDTDAFANAVSLSKPLLDTKAAGDDKENKMYGKGGVVQKFSRDMNDKELKIIKFKTRLYTILTFGWYRSWDMGKANIKNLADQKIYFYVLNFNEQDERIKKICANNFDPGNKDTDKDKPVLKDFSTLSVEEVGDLLKKCEEIRKEVDPIKEQLQKVLRDKKDIFIAAILKEAKGHPNEKELIDEAKKIMRSDSDFFSQYLNMQKSGLIGIFKQCLEETVKTEKKEFVKDPAIAKCEELGKLVEQLEKNKSPSSHIDFYISLQRANPNSFDFLMDLYSTKDAIDAAQKIKVPRNLKLIEEALDMVKRYTGPSVEEADEHNLCMQKLRDTFKRYGEILDKISVDIGPALTEDPVPIKTEYSFGQYILECNLVSDFESFTNLRDRWKLHEITLEFLSAFFKDPQLNPMESIENLYSDPQIQQKAKKAGKLYTQ